MDEARKRWLLEYTVGHLLEERRARLGEPAPAPGSLPDAVNGLWRIFRGLVNVRPAWPAAPDFLAAQDELLQGLIAQAGVVPLQATQAAPASPQLRLWRGDITTLAADAIVNAANSQMTGCWAANHHCIDNAIHTFAGVQLRAECHRLMQVQGHAEPTAQAKITGAYNLPAQRVIHTVGPIANGAPTSLHRRQLAQCYERCLDCAAAAGMRSLAFCCISTGVFGFPQEEAARIAVGTVQSWLQAHPQPDFTVVFNVFLPEDEAHYRNLLF